MTKGWNRRYLLIGVVAALLLATAGVAYALTSASFEPRAAAWESSTCNETLLRAKESAATNQKIATCFAVEKAKEQQSTISSLQASVAKLESTQTPPPLDFTFFSGASANKTTITSPVLDASKYKTLTLTATHGGGGISSYKLEVSNDQAVWVTDLDLSGSVQNDALSVTAKYYRITATGEGGANVTAFAHLTS